MAKNDITDFDSTADNNTDIQSVDIAENCAPSGINNAIRELMADLADVNDGTVALTSPQFTSADINGGTIDGTTIGGTTAAAGSFTTVSATGNITVGGTVDGRDVATDGTKLDGIESSADVTDTTNVVAALTAGTNVTIAADGTISSTDTNTTYTVGDGGLTEKNFTTALKTKLDGVETGATADQTASEILTAIKTVDGASSGLDADTVDGVEASSFLRSDANDSMSHILTISGSGVGGYPRLKLSSNSSTSTSYIDMGVSSDSDHGQINYNHGSSSGDMYFIVNATDAMQIASNGRIINKRHMNSASAPAFAMRNTSGETAYDTGIYSPDISQSNAIGFAIDGSEALVLAKGLNNFFRAGADDTYYLGASNKRWKLVYAVTGTINTSDENEKQQISVLTDAEMTAAKAISKLFKTYKWNSSVASKGDDARIHTGVIAQQVQQAMTDAGLDAADYSFFCSDTWWESGDNVYYTSDDSTPDDATEVTRLGIRYTDLLAFVSAATEQRLAELETQNADFEARLTALEA